jgi:serine/threonine protein kinase
LRGQDVAGERECARLRREVDIGSHFGPIEGLVRFRDHEQQDAEADEQAAGTTDEQAAGPDEQVEATDEQAEPVAYAVMDYLEGETLHERLKRGLLSEEEALTLGIRTGEILCRLHARGIIHRDIKPENLLLGRMAGCGCSIWASPNGRAPRR